MVEYKKGCHRKSKFRFPEKKNSQEMVFKNLKNQT